MNEVGCRMPLSMIVRLRSSGPRTCSTYIMSYYGAPCWGERRFLDAGGGEIFSCHSTQLLPQAGSSRSCITSTALFDTTIPITFLQKLSKMARKFFVGGNFKM